MDRSRIDSLATRCGVLCYIVGAGLAVTAARCMVFPCDLRPGSPLALLFTFAPGTFLLGAVTMTLVASRERILKVMLILTLVLWLVELTSDVRAVEVGARVAYAAGILWNAVWWWVSNYQPGPRGTPRPVRRIRYLQEAYESAVRTFAVIRASVPNLQHEYREGDGSELLLVFPRQPGLDFEVQLHHYDDYLQFTVDGDWFEYFPGGEPEVAARFREAVAGLLDGSWRIQQARLDGDVVKSILERPADGGWKRVYVSRRLHLPVGRHSDTILQNSGEPPPST